MAPAVGLIGWFVYGFVLWTLYISFTNSKILPKYELWGFGQYEKLWASRKWLISVDNLLVTPTESWQLKNVENRINLVIDINQVWF